MYPLESALAHCFLSLLWSKLLRDQRFLRQVILAHDTFSRIWDNECKRIILTMKMRVFIGPEEEKH